MSNPFDDIPFDDEPSSAPLPQAGGGSGIAARAMAARSAPTYLDGLNPEQRRAVETVEGPVLVLAGAGTGKTRVLTTRIAHILGQGHAWPSQILAVTFTNKAAREMKERIGVLVGGAVEGMPWLGTFHSIGVKILRKHAELVGLKSDFTILDTDDQIRLIKQLIQAEGIDDKRWPARTFAHLMDSWKNKGWNPADIPEGDARSFANGKGRELFTAYQDRLRTLNAADFGDLLCHPIRILKNHPDVLAEYHKRFKYILVDEYQDTNVAQYMWLRLLSQRSGMNNTPSVAEQVEATSRDTSSRTDASADAFAENKQGSRYSAAPNICCVGDDDQSIYGWRGAEVDNILRFERDFPGAAVIKLERNYRSTAHILGAASHLISHNEGRLGKTLFTDEADIDDPKVQVHAAWDSEEEARAIGEVIERLHSDQHDLNDMAILVRASFQMREFEERFIKSGINYRVIGGPRFYERMEIRDAMAFFRVVCQPADDLAFERIINVPKRGLGDASVRLIHDYARRKNIPMLAASAEIIEATELKPKPRAALREVVLNFDRWTKALDKTSHIELAETILEESGYTGMWQADRSAEAPGRLENLKELITSMSEFESLRSFLEHVSLVMDVEQNADDDKVSIMTLHAAKGLEFKTVFLPGFEEGLFPHQRSLDEGGRNGLEEERRLAYVGLTRAKINCHIWFVSNRRIHGLWQSTIPSRFLDELPTAHVDVAEPPTSYGGGGGTYGQSRFDRAEPFQNTYSTPGWARAQANKTDATRNNWGSRSGSNVERVGYGETDSSFGAGKGSIKGRVIEGELVAKSIADTPSQFEVGDRVFHLKFGNGNISQIDGNKLTINFDKAGEKKVLDGFVEQL